MNLGINREIKRKAIGLYLDEKIGLEYLKVFIGRKDANSVRVTSEILKNSEEKATRMANLAK